LELAATARQAGADVMVLEAAPRLMGRAVPEAIAEVVHGRHLNEGVDLRTGAQVASADTGSITLKDGTKIHFDLVIAGTGALPNTALAEAAGLEVDNGIRVDACFRTSANDVFAAGDCCNFPWAGANVRLESWQAAQEQGAHAAAAMLGETSDYARIPWFWSDQYDLSLQVAGLFDSSSASVRRNISDNAFVLFQADASGRLIAVAGIGSGNAIAKDIKLAEKLIDRGALLDESAFSDPTVNLKSLLRAA
jgi:3-phenylpropionate/trans-cinnamate dioxygenase ferredoxin reductase subunit